MKIEKFDHSASLSPAQHKHLDLIRRLEGTEFEFAKHPESATLLAKNEPMDAYQKLCHRAKIIDADGRLAKALAKADFQLNLAEKIYATIAFVLGYIGVFGLLSSNILNFFYVLLGLIGWSTITFIIWLFTAKNSAPHGIVHGIIERLHPDSQPNKAAFDIYLEEFEQNGKWRIFAIMHKAWLFGLFGSVLALLTLFLFKSYAFAWESTLLSSEHFTSILAALGYVPSLLGFTIPTADAMYHTDTARNLAILMMASVVIYGMIPRFFALLFCRYKSKSIFKINPDLYYYENLLRIFSRTVVDEDDFVPATPMRTNVSEQSRGLKIVAMLERPTPDLQWHKNGVIPPFKYAGTVDTTDEINMLVSACNSQNAQIYLGIDTKGLPDRGVMRKFDYLLTHCHQGMVVQLVNDGEFTPHWRRELGARSVTEIHVVPDESPLN